MTDRPIIFSAPMARALLEGRKTQTRRIIKPQPDAIQAPDSMDWWTGFMGWQPVEACVAEPMLKQHVCPFGRPGDRLWVRENHRFIHDLRAPDLRLAEYGATVSDRHFKEMKWRPSIHMPRWASRLTLVVTDIRAQRVQDISASDLEAEGIVPLGTNMDINAAHCVWIDLWNSLHGHGAWAANPWVWALTFAVHQNNIDALPATAQEAA